MKGGIADRFAICISEKMESDRISMLRKIIHICIALFLVLTVLFIFILYKMDSIYRNEDRQNMLVSLNEIEKLTEQDGVSPAQEQIDDMTHKLRQKENDENKSMRLYAAGIYLCSIFFMAVIFAYVYIKIMRPFSKLEKYAGELAKGNLDVALNYERTNIFGSFTWAFDHMRREISKARVCEREAIENNKTVISTLSHDIKTPISSIRTYAEGLRANMDTNLERKERYLKVIMNKCDEVTELTNDLFLHSIADLDKLQIGMEKCDVSQVISQTVEEMQGDKPDIKLIGSRESCIIEADEKRLRQVLENIISNSRKYAKDTDIDIWYMKKTIYYEMAEIKNNTAGAVEIHIKDHGEGIPDEDMPFIFDKFYRGMNSAGESGAGLGLYIVKYIMQQMNGDVELINREDGLEAVLYLDEWKNVKK